MFFLNKHSNFEKKTHELSYRLNIYIVSTYLPPTPNRVKRIPFFSLFSHLQNPFHERVEFLLDSKILTKIRAQVTQRATCRSAQRATSQRMSELAKSWNFDKMPKSTKYSSSSKIWTYRCFNLFILSRHRKLQNLRQVVKQHLVILVLWGGAFNWCGTKRAQIFLLPKSSVNIV